MIFTKAAFGLFPARTFQARDRAPVVMGARCHHLALYVVCQNPMPMVTNAPGDYEGQTGFDFITEMATNSDETRFLAGDPGEYVIIARRKGKTWYIGGITNSTGREIDVPMDFLGGGRSTAKLYVDGSMDESRPMLSAANA